jgi:leucyl aminopeptidase
MDVRVERGDGPELETPLLAVHLVEGGDLSGPIARLDERLAGRIGEVVRRGDFRGRADETLLLYPMPGELAAERLLLVGLGKSGELDAERVRRATATAARQAQRLRVPRFASLLPREELASRGVASFDAGRAAAEAGVLAAFAFRELKTPPSDEPPPVDLERLTLVEPVGEEADQLAAGARVGAVSARGENLARRLGNLPGNVATPGFLAETAREIARAHGMRCTVLGREAIAAEGLKALLAVARGTDEEPQFIVLEHRAGKEGERPVVLLGKGLTFDAGGISIKPALGMEEMKFDMCGGAAVLGAMQAIGELGVPLNVVGVVPATENLLSGSAVKPGDVIGSHLGKSIEVVNTDAEGRLILADGLSFIRRFEPAAVVDVATLTGACVIALGAQASAMLSNDEGLVAELRDAADRTGQRVWPLPMYPEYREQLKSEYADIKNSGGRPAGTITAAWFLRDFVGEFPWAHLDIAGTAWGDGKLPYQSKGATGAPTRLLVEWVLSRLP